MGAERGSRRSRGDTKKTWRESGTGNEREVKSHLVKGRLIKASGTSLAKAELS